MTPEQLKIAISNATDPEAKSKLIDLAPIFEKVYELNETFPERINANKAARGERPTKVSSRKREELAQYEKDAIDIDRGLTEDFRTQSPSSIIYAMSYALDTDLSFWGGAMLKHAHPADRPLVEEVFAAKSELQSKFKQYLKRFPPADDDEHDS